MNLIWIYLHHHRRGKCGKFIKTSRIEKEYQEKQDILLYVSSIFYTVFLIYHSTGYRINGFKFYTLQHAGMALLCWMGKLFKIIFR